MSDNGIDGSGTTRASCLLAPNPSPMTLDGTNTWVLTEPESRAAVIVDPGPDDIGHARRVAAAVAERGLTVEQILLTHHHDDHFGGAAALSKLVEAPVRAFDPAFRINGEGLADGDVVTVGGLEVRVLSTPGHTDDSLTFFIPADGALLTGDTVLGRGTTVLHRLSDYLRSLDRLRGLVSDGDVRIILPAHGPVIPDPATALDFYISHRKERIAEVRAAVDAGDRTVDEIVSRVYADVDRSVWFAARGSVRAQLDYLSEQGALPTDMRLD